MSEQARAWVSLIPTAKGFQSKVAGEIGPDVEKAGKAAGKQYEKGAAGGIGKVKAALAGAFVGGAAISVLKGFVADARESQQIGARTVNVIKTTGGAAHVTADQVGALATAISNKTGVDDEAIQSGENLLLTFTNVRNEVGKGNDIFNQASSLVTDMSVALGQDAKAGALQLGKALNDPIKGVGALSRVGVSFTEQQKKQIATLVKSGDTLGAQKVILAELGKEFGGAAEAAATPTKKLSVTVGNLKESIGTALLPVVDKTATFLNDKLIPALSDAAGFVKEHSTLFKVLAAVVGTVVTGLLLYNGTVGVVTKVTKAWQAAQAILNAELALNPIGLIVVGLAALAAGLILAYKHSETFRVIVGKAFAYLVAPVGLFLTAIEGVFRALGHIPGFGWAKTAAREVGALHDKLDGLKTSLNGLPKNTNLKVTTTYVTIGHGPLANKRLPIDGARAAGGPVVAGKAYVVGEQGREVFVPEQNGTILNQRQILAATGAGVGGGTVIEHLEQHTHNPLPEPASVSNANMLRRLGFVLGAA
jgi:hypothetical protein